MSWQNEMVLILRYMINDLDGVSYSDSRLEETLLVAAQLQYMSIDFANTYTIDVDSSVLTPDPTATTPKDDWFIALVCMKAASIVLYSEAKTLAAQSYRIKDGPSSIDITTAYQATKQIADDMADKLAIAIMQMKAGDSIAGQAVLTPYTQSYVSEGNPIRNFS